MPGTGYNGSVIVNATGQQLVTPTLPEMNSLQPVGTDGIYSEELNIILSPATGDTIWSSRLKSDRKGAVSGGNVVFASGNTVRAEPY